MNTSTEVALTYDQLIELICDIEEGGALLRQRKILTALRELVERRTNERVAENLASAPDIPVRPRCEGCGNEIDPDTCGCGDRMDHSPWAGHQPIPMGCDCGRAR